MTVLAGPSPAPGVGHLSVASVPADVDVLLSLLLALGLAITHLYAGRLEVLDGVPRSWVLSVAGGASVAYVFVHVLPELERVGGTIGDRPAALPVIEEHGYVLALLGFVAYYGLERFVRVANEDGPSGASGVFWLHVSSFAVYNGLIGYLLVHRETPGVGNLLLFAGAMGLHFLVNDYGLRDHHGRAYRRTGRWVLAGAVLAGTLVGWATAVAPTIPAAAFAVLAGGIVLNVVKEELPPERRSRFWLFALGAAGYALVLLSV